MARRLCSSSFQDVTVAGSSAETTFLQLLAATAKPIELVRLDLTTDAAAAEIGPLVKIVRQTTAGTASDGVVTALDSATGSPATTAKITYTVEPTMGDVLWRGRPSATEYNEIALTVPGDVTVTNEATLMPSGSNVGSWSQATPPPVKGIYVPAAGRIGIVCAGPTGRKLSGTVWFYETI